jgi:hypothetical protein
MATWAQTSREAGNRQTCSTRLRSNLIVRASDFGAALGTTTRDGVTTYPDVEPGYLIEWSAMTESKDRAISDRVTAKLIRLDTVYLSGLINDIQATNPSIDEQGLLEALAEQGDMNRLFATVSSQTVTTGSDGIAKGVLPTSDMPPGPATVVISYGYSAQSERGDTAKALRFWTNEVMEEVVSGLIASAACAGAVATGGALAFACVMGISLAVSGANLYRQYAKDALGMVGVNKEGCSFPIGGHMHTYALAVGGDRGAIQASSSISPAVVESGLGRRVDYGRIIVGALIGSAAILAIMLSLGGSSE